MQLRIWEDENNEIAINVIIVSIINLMLIEMKIFIIIILGFIFGWLLSYGKLNRYNTIAGLSMLKDFTVAKTIMLVLGIGSLLLMFEMMSGNAVFHLKPLYMIGTTIGGVIFGVGMSILGYCPGTLPISMGQGSVDALLGIIGGIIAGVVYTLTYPLLFPLLGIDFGKLSVFNLMGGTFSVSYILVVLLVSIVMIVGAFVLHKFDVKRGNLSRNWIVTAIGLTALNVVLFYQGWMNRPMGASSSYPFIGDSICSLTSNDYFYSIFNSGSWQTWFLLGAMIAGFVYAIATKTFRVQLIYERWQEYKGRSKSKRVLYSLLGGFLLIFGARMAGGCTSGHIISGGMQLAISSYVFAIFTFIGFLATGYLFYTRHK